MTLEQLILKIHLEQKPKNASILFHILTLISSNGKVGLYTLMANYGVSKTQIYRLLKFINEPIICASGTYYFKIENSLIGAYCDKVIKPKKETQKKENKPKVVVTDDGEIIKMQDVHNAIIDYLNLKSNKSYKSEAAQTKKMIEARLNEGYKLDDFKKVIDNKCATWLNSSMEAYLRPITLFSNKMDGYLNEVPQNQNSGLNNLKNNLENASNFDWEAQNLNNE